MDRKRINFLDGFRGMAIILVMLYHSYSRWPNIVPYGTRYSDFPIFKYGNLGVELFFLISGFVILMSLERSKSFLTFISKRWLRLFPAMLIATVLIYSTSYFLSERPNGLPDIKSAIPGLIFMEPHWINFFTGIYIPELEGTFWSLYAEVKFYLIFGILYFTVGKINAIIGLILMYFICLISYQLHFEILYSFCYSFSFIYFGYFAVGALAYIYYSTKQKSFLYSALLLSIIVAAIEILKHKSFDFYLITFVLCIFALFFSPIYFTNLKLVTSNKLFHFFGFVSYPLYLIHENAMIALIIKFNNITSHIPHLLLPLLPIVILAFISYLIAKYVEPFIRKLIEKILFVSKLENSK
ncbi:hypothetical protein FFWV33_12120 [Flavobacterium faecale]|uniref:Acyltransferase 3 domain-containing protein n=1 Tax=Flavobacterium faecale TaxID=1355330 RepID=A0A2S1LEP7_9FLAO|nr:acyltransferase [Flavobacterium faecale]AWG22207.1 hypothetical protein FFWV33_12120 [Flavobacterium faecale]